MARQKSVAKEKAQPPAARGRKGVVTWRRRREFIAMTIATNQALFDELIALGIREARAARLYSQIENGRCLTQEEIASALGISHQTNVSRDINAVLHYLDPTIRVGRFAERHAKRIAKYVARLRSPVEKTRQEIRAQEEIENRKFAAKRLGVSKLPDNLPHTLFEEFAAVRKARRDGRFAKLRQSFPRSAEILQARYGSRSAIFQSYREIDPDHPGIPYYFARVGLETLGIRQKKEEKQAPKAQEEGHS